ncbi:hypothetical protein BGZ60DRAFT_518722 [Tricladium varicosporioides]|nr:hypothetical protein BGZ60DRAFT_518722 [Hymenoscyphus varicosporioides]
MQAYQTYFFVYNIKRRWNHPQNPRLCGVKTARFMSENSFTDSEAPFIFRGPRNVVDYVAHVPHSKSQHNSKSLLILAVEHKMDHSNFHGLYDLPKDFVGLSLIAVSVYLILLIIVDLLPLSRKVISRAPAIKSWEVLGEDLNAAKRMAEQAQQEWAVKMTSKALEKIDGLMGSTEI